MPATRGIYHAATTNQLAAGSIAHPFGKLRAGSCKKRKDGPLCGAAVQISGTECDYAPIGAIP
jgi:hypothetical protein